MICKINKATKRYVCYLTRTDTNIVLTKLLSQHLPISRYCKQKGISYNSFSAVLNRRTSVGRKYRYILQEDFGIGLDKPIL
jgi:hypothetical protein